MKSEWWWRIWDSNPWPLPCKGSALPTELIPHNWLGWKVLPFPWPGQSRLRSLVRHTPIKLRLATSFEQFWIENLLMEAALVGGLYCIAFLLHIYYIIFFLFFQQSNLMVRVERLELSTHWLKVNCATAALHPQVYYFWSLRFSRSSFLTILPLSLPLLLRRVILFSIARSLNSIFSFSFLLITYILYHNFF